jgi:hypothetical protein
MSVIKQIHIYAWDDNKQEYTLLPETSELFTKYQIIPRASERIWLSGHNNSDGENFGIDQIELSSLTYVTKQNEIIISVYGESC